MARTLKFLVHTLVDLVQGRNSLNDVVVVLVDGELDLGTRVGVTETENGAVDIAGLELLDQLLAVLAETSEQIGDDLAGLGGFAGEVGEGSLDATGEVTGPELAWVARRSRCAYRSKTPRVMVFFLPDLGRLVSRVALR